MVLGLSVHNLQRSLYSILSCPGFFIFSRSTFPDGFHLCMLATALA
jgi:hypothetical protein